MDKKSDNPISSRLEQLEVLSMEQENTIEILNREVHRQQLQIKAIEAQLEYLKTQIASIHKEDQSAVIDDNVPPPHY